MRDKKTALLAGMVMAGLGCTPPQKPEPYVPALRYAVPNSTAQSRGLQWEGALVQDSGPDGRAQMKFVEVPPAPQSPQVLPEAQVATAQGVQLKQTAADLGDGVRVIRSSSQMPPPYPGRLEEGDPGMSASLYREDRVNNELYRDFRPFQPMDLLTIVVTERSLGRQFAITEVKSKSEVLAGISKFFGLENRPEEQWTYPPDMSALIAANTKNDFKGEGNTNRQSELTGRLSAVVVEVLPSGLLRIEGEKILVVNNEEQVMVISGLVRQRDISSNNEVNSSQIAQMRIDYYGKGTVGEAQYGGWFARTMRILWPF